MSDYDRGTIGELPHARDKRYATREAIELLAVSRVPYLSSRRAIGELPHIFYDRRGAVAEL